MPLWGGCQLASVDSTSCRMRVPNHPPFRCTYSRTAALVERYIDAHAGSHTIWELEGSVEAGSSNSAGDGPPAQQQQQQVRGGGRRVTLVSVRSD